MVATLLWRELCTGLARDKVTEGRRLTFEFARLVIGIHPVGDLSRVTCLHSSKC